MKKSKKVIGYVRTNVSGEEGNESIKNQINNLCNYCTSNKIRLGQIFCDAVVSDSKFGPELKKLIQLANLTILESKIILIDNTSIFGPDIKNLLKLRLTVFIDDFQIEVINKTQDEINKPDILFTNVPRRNKQRKS